MFAQIYYEKKQKKSASLRKRYLNLYPHNSKKLINRET